jgi:prolyl-tRNA editing enzyme YbaK/EbsC (Cys-tRNA(Pro) deacylase)
MDDLSHPAIQRVVQVATRKGVALDIVFVHPSTRTAAEAAAIIGADLGQLVKAIVFVASRPDGRLVPIVCLVSGRNHVDTGKLAAVLGESAIRRASPHEARQLTGFPVGGIPPIGFDHGIRVVMDSDLGRYQVVWAAAGTHAAVFPVTPFTLRALSNATVAPIAEDPWSRPATSATMEPQLQAS